MLLIRVLTYNKGNVEGRVMFATREAVSEISLRIIRGTCALDVNRDNDPYMPDTSSFFDFNAPSSGFSCEKRHYDPDSSEPLLSYSFLS